MRARTLARSHTRTHARKQFLEEKIVPYVDTASRKMSVSYAATASYSTPEIKSLGSQSWCVHRHVYGLASLVWQAIHVQHFFSLYECTQYV